MISTLVWGEATSLPNCCRGFRLFLLKLILTAELCFPVVVRLKLSTTICCWRQVYLATFNKSSQNLILNFLLENKETFSSFF